MQPSSHWTRSALAGAALALCAATAVARPDVASLVFANGEALPPEAEARLTALTTTPGGGMTRAEVRLQLSEARSDGSLAEAGEMADRPAVLQARLAANERQTGQILAAHAAQRERLAAIEVAAEVRRQAELLARQASAASDTQTLTVASTDSRSIAASPASASVDPLASAPLSTERAAVSDGPTNAPSEGPNEGPADRPTDIPGQGPRDRPALAPVEGPISRPADLPDEMLLDVD